jgi:hypothetical protein
MKLLRRLFGRRGDIVGRVGAVEVDRPRSRLADQRGADRGIVQRRGDGEDDRVGRIALAHGFEPVAVAVERLLGRQRLGIGEVAERDDQRHQRVVGIERQPARPPWVVWSTPPARPVPATRAR